MRSVVIYESMFGSTKKVAEAVAQGLAPCSEMTVVPVAEVVPVDLDGVDLVVVGAPTHFHGMPRPSTRKGAREMTEKPDSRVELLPGADQDPGVREWLGSLGRVEMAYAAFDTRLKGPSAFTGRASKPIGRLLARHGARAAARPESFLVDKTGALMAGELARARSWGEHLTWSDCVRRVVEGRSARASTR